MALASYSRSGPICSTRRQVVQGAVAITASRGIFGSAIAGATADLRSLQMKKLIDAYPDQLASVGSNAIIWRDGTSMPWAITQRAEDFDQLLNSADLRSQVSARYVPGPLLSPPIENQDPGRLRYEPFFKKMYGESEAEVRGRLREVRWAPGRTREPLLASSVNGVNRLLERIGDDLAGLEPKYRKFLENPAGAFLWRRIRHTKRMSLHAFGIAIDLNASFGDYWEESGRASWHNQIPIEIVEVFERYKFIWGGKWFHYDTLHFEYRPELF